MAAENGNYTNNYGNGGMLDTGNSTAGLTKREGHTPHPGGMSDAEADRFERFAGKPACSYALLMLTCSFELTLGSHAAALASNNKLRDASRVNSLRWVAAIVQQLLLLPCPPHLRAQCRVGDVGPLGLYAFGFTTALLQVGCLRGLGCRVGYEGCAVPSSSCGSL